MFLPTNDLPLSSNFDSTLYTDDAAMILSASNKNLLKNRVNNVVWKAVYSGASQKQDYLTANSILSEIITDHNSE